MLDGSSGAVRAAGGPRDDDGLLYLLFSSCSSCRLSDTSLTDSGLRWRCALLLCSELAVAYLSSTAESWSKVSTDERDMARLVRVCARCNVEPKSLPARGAPEAPVSLAGEPLPVLYALNDASSPPVPRDLSRPAVEKNPCC